MVFNNPRGRQAVDISSAFTGIMVIIVSLRFYTRIFLIRYAGIEDYMILLAMICSIGLTVCIGYQVKWGMGMHAVDLSEDELTKSLKAFWCSLIVYYLSLGLTKASILLQYQRVFFMQNFKIASWCTMAIVILYTIWTVFSSIFACIPVQAFWTKQSSRCLDQFAMWFTNAAINILTDFVIILLPMPVIRSLNLARRQKQALLGIFAIGGFVCVVSILRLRSLVSISNSRDQTHDNPAAATWSSVETNVGIICSCLPLLRPLMTRYLPGVFSSSKRTTNVHTTRRLPRFSRNRYSVQLPDAYPLDGSTGLPIGDSGSDIKVVTDISVKVEGESSKSISRCAQSNLDSNKDTDLKTISYAESLVKETRDVI